MAATSGVDGGNAGGELGEVTDDDGGGGDDDGSSAGGDGEVETTPSSGGPSCTSAPWLGLARVAGTLRAPEVSGGSRATLDAVKAQSDAQNEEMSF